MALPKGPKGLKAFPAPSLCFISLPLTVLTVSVPGASLPEWEFGRQECPFTPRSQGPHYIPVLGTDHFQ